MTRVHKQRRGDSSVFLADTRGTTNRCNYILNRTRSIIARRARVIHFIRSVAGRPAATRSFAPRRRSVPDIDDSPSERNNSRVCRNTGRCVRDSRGAFHVRYLGICYAECGSRSGTGADRSIQTGQKRQSARRHRDGSEYSTSRRIREKEKEEEKKNNPYSRFRMSADSLTFSVIIDELSFMFQDAR